MVCARMLELASNNLAGSVPDAISALASLQYVDTVDLLCWKPGNHGLGECGDDYVPVVLALVVFAGVKLPTC